MRAPIAVRAILRRIPAPGKKKPRRVPFLLSVLPAPVYTLPRRHPAVRKESPRTSVTPPAAPTTAPPPRLLDRLGDALRSRGYVAALRQAYVDWARRYLHFHHLRHPETLGPAEVGAFLAALAGQPDLPPAAEVEARAALLFLCEVVLGRPLGELPSAVGRRSDAVPRQRGRRLKRPAAGAPHHTRGSGRSSR